MVCLLQKLNTGTESGEAERERELRGVCVCVCVCVNVYVQSYVYHLKGEVKSGENITPNLLIVLFSEAKESQRDSLYLSWSMS